MLQRRRKVIAYIDPVDIRFNRFEPQPLPNANAVMFCLMDVSGSMGEREKDLAKRFFVLLHLFLKRRYERTDIVFIRHTHEAQEVDEETFFYSTQSGGTVVSTALEEMRRIIEERYPSREWNIYAAQASDGDNFAGRFRALHRAPRQRADEAVPVLSPMSRSSTSAKATSSARPTTARRCGAPIAWSAKTGRISR